MLFALHVNKFHKFHSDTANQLQLTTAVYKGTKKCTQICTKSTSITKLHQYSESLTTLTFAVDDWKSIGCQLRGTFNPYDKRTATPKNPCVQNTQIYSKD